MTPTCPDLRQLAGETYQVWNEVEQRKAYAADDAWDLVIPGWCGFVGVWGPGRLVAATRSSATTRRTLATVPDAVVVADATDGANIVFAAEHLEMVAPLLRLRKRRRLSPERRRAGAERLAPFRLKKRRSP
jgi:hypothetical protein